MCRIKFLGLAIIALSLTIMSLGQAFAQDDAIAEAIPDASPSDSSSPKLRPLTVSAGLIDSTVITGTLLESTELSIKTAFGQAAIPLSEVAGIRFPAAEDSGTTVVMLNGDSITGVTDLKYASVETSWGSARINGQNISTLLFVPGLRWESVEALGGKRWSLVEATSPGSFPASQGVQQASGSIPLPSNRISPSSNILPSNRPPVIYGR